MDAEELDKWLDSELAAEPTGTAQTHPTIPPVESRRPPWKWIGVFGGGVWLLVMIVVFLGGEKRADQATADVLVTPSSTSRPSPTAEPTAGQTGRPGDVPEVATPPTPTGPPVAAAGVDHAIAAATVALRSRLTRPGDVAEGVPTSYLEWATAVEVLPLGAGIRLVVLDAVWLQGDDNELEDAHHAQWAVPVGDDDVVLATPWPHSDSQEQPGAASAPPVGTVRIDEVTQAVADAGWHDVTIAGSDPHPILADAIVALVQGVPPGGRSATADVIWLQEDQDGRLQVPGTTPISAGDPSPEPAIEPSQKSSATGLDGTPQ